MNQEQFNKKRAFFQTNSDFFYVLSKHPPQAVIFYLHLRSLSDAQYSPIWHALPAIAKQLGWSMRTVQRCVSILEKAKIITTDKYIGSAPTIHFSLELQYAGKTSPICSRNTINLRQKTGSFVTKSAETSDKVVITKPIKIVPDTKPAVTDQYLKDQDIKINNQSKSEPHSITKPAPTSDKTDLINHLRLRSGREKAEADLMAIIPTSFKSKIERLLSEWRKRTDHGIFYIRCLRDYISEAPKIENKAAYIYKALIDASGLERVMNEAQKKYRYHKGMWDDRRQIESMYFKDEPKEMPRQSQPDERVAKLIANLSLKMRVAN